MAFYYHDNLRLQFFGCSPNITAYLLILALFLLWGAEAVVRTHCQQKHAKTASFFFLGLSSAVIESIVLTYSRGGFIALAFCLVGLCLTEFKMLRKYLAIIAMAFLLTPSAVSRVTSIGDRQDASILNRLTLWYNSCAMIVDNWQRGTGSDKGPGVTYSIYYQPLEKKEHYWTMVNDSLTLSAQHGLPVAFLFFTAFFLALACHLMLGYRHGLILFRYSSAAIASLFICGLFSTILLSRLACCIAILFVLSTPLCCIKLRMAVLKKCLPSAAVCASLAVCVIVAVGLIARRGLFFKLSKENINLSGVEVSTERFVPKKGNGRSVLILSDEFTEHDVRCLILPLCHEGFEVTMFLIPTNEEDFLLECIRHETLRAASSLSVLGDTGIVANRVLRACARNDAPTIDMLFARDPIAKHYIEYFSFENLTFPDRMRTYVIWTTNSADWSEGSPSMESNARECSVSYSGQKQYTTVFLPELTGTALARLLNEVTVADI